MKNKPKVIFLDAVGTIFGVRKSVGHIYSQIANNYGVESEANMINDYFYESFKASPPLAFTNQNHEEIKVSEFNWWKNVARETFVKADLLETFSDFNAFFRELYQYFQTKEPWFIYPDAIPSLQNWQQQGIELGIISNFDTRIYTVLEKLKLRQYFLTITISSMAGSAKPDSKIFITALTKHNCIPENAWHIGDSMKEDYWGAKSVGINSFWLRR